MGKCIVCNKSAGPFYSLHKSCYKVYEDTRECLRRAFSRAIKSSVQQSKLEETINECRPIASFSQSLFVSLVKREWQDQALQIVKTKTPNSEYADYLLSMAKILEIDAIDIEPHLFTRLANIKHLEDLNQNKIVLQQSTELHNKLELVTDEILIWVFDDTVKEEQQTQAADQKWTVFQSILSNLLNKSRYKELEVEVKGTGKLVISNQGLYYIIKETVTKTKFVDFYSITPLKDGVRIQTTQRNATPDTYITGDGRFTYALLQYAADQNNL